MTVSQQAVLTQWTHRAGAGLEAIPLRDRPIVKQVFSVFALVAEDTLVPLSAFRILLSAITGSSELVPELQLRKYLQILLNRSLVLGTWEKPQLHDSKCLFNHLSHVAAKRNALDSSVVMAVSCQLFAIT